MTEQELGAALRLHKQLARKRGTLADLRETGGVGSVSGRETGGGGVNLGASQAAVELSEDIAQLEHQLLIEQEIIRRGIAKLPLEGWEHQLLTYRYVDCWEWRSLAKLMGYTTRHTHKLHRALIVGLIFSGAITKMTPDDTQ